MKQTILSRDFYRHQRQRPFEISSYMTSPQNGAITTSCSTYRHGVESSLYKSNGKRNIRPYVFLASWSLKERKERERYQVVIEQPPDDMNTTTLALKENISSLIQRDIRMFKESHHLSPSNNKAAYKTTNKIKPSKRPNTNKSQNLSLKSNTVGTGLNRIPIGNRKGSKQAKKTEDDTHKISPRSSNPTKKHPSKKPRISKKKLAADIATIMETLKSLVRQ
ncbi:hypothetical protein RclHR1_28320002 [Rhizophagus clarus]|uniref:Uncharacterized protein n=1 Tax=Rhizophagus clarus TaxID=94130 RepID=A0A2Z6R331_9GLOM|nr:hypothetical protein RclHR1_28320002 [Rhizophagus clarus]